MRSPETRRFSLLSSKRRFFSAFDTPSRMERMPPLFSEECVSLWHAGHSFSLRVAVTRSLRPCLEFDVPRLLPPHFLLHFFLQS